MVDEYVDIYNNFIKLFMKSNRINTETLLVKDGEAAFLTGPKSDDM